MDIHKKILYKTIREELLHLEASQIGVKETIKELRKRLKTMRNGEHPTKKELIKEDLKEELYN
jgi:hypothetical protein